MRKLIVAVGALALIGTVVAACGGGGGDDKKTATVGPDNTGQPVTTQRVPLDTATILNQNKNTVVDIETTDANGAGGGTGIVWGDSSHVLTNAHVVVGGGSIKITDPTDSSRSYPAKVIALSSCDDVALLQVDRAQNLQPAKIGDSDQVKPGDHVIALGFPATLSSGPVTAIVTEGNVSRVHATFDFGGQRDLVQHTAPINPGNSGSPLFNQYGEVIGMNAYSARGSQSENYAISMNEAKTVADELKAGKNIDYIGVTLEPNDRDFAEEEGFAYIDGLAVLAVDPEVQPTPLSPIRFSTATSSSTSTARRLIPWASSATSSARTSPAIRSTCASVRTTRTTSHTTTSSIRSWSPNPRLEQRSTGLVRWALAESWWA